MLERADELARFTEEPGRITRPLASPSLAAAMARLRGWMEAAGLETRSDALGNLAGRRGAGTPLIIGSHLDSVADAGRYDGILGVLIGLEVAEADRRVRSSSSRSPTRRACASSPRSSAAARSSGSWSRTSSR